MSEVKQQVTRIIKAMHEDWSAFSERQEAGFRELDNLLSGGIGIGERMKHVETEFAAAWATRYQGDKYVFDYPAGRKMMKTLIVTKGLDHAEIARRAWVYIKSDEPGLQRARHPFLWFLKGINQYADEAPR